MASPARRPLFPLFATRHSLFARALSFGDESPHYGQMTKGALALLITGGTENWSPVRWRERFTTVCPDRAVALLPDDKVDPAAVHFAAVWKPPPGALKTFPNLAAIFNLGAGVDALMADASLPDVPIVRVADEDLTGRMTEYVVMHVLIHHRHQRYIDARSEEHTSELQSRFGI